MLSWEYPPHSTGGLGRHVQDLSEALAKRGEKVDVLAPGPENKTEKAEGVTIHWVEGYPLAARDFLTWVLQGNLRLAEEGAKLLKNHHFQVIHAHDWLVALAARSLKHSFQLPLIATVHATESGRNQGIYNDLQRYIHSVEWFLTFEAWKVIVCSQSMKNEVRDLFSLPEDKLQVVYNGVKPVSRLPRRTKTKFAAADEDLVFFVGRLVREKGVQLLVEAAPQVLREHPGAKFVIAGSGPMEGQLREMVRQSGLEQKFYFTGYIDNATRNQLFASATAAVFPSLYEPFGIVALEAMACGTPVVVADTGGLGEIVSHGQNGLKFYPGNAPSLAGNLVRILKDRELQQKVREEAKNTLQTFDWDKVAAATIEIYQRVWQEYRRSSWRSGGMGQIFNSTKVKGEEHRGEDYSLITRRLGRVNLDEGGGAW